MIQICFPVNRLFVLKIQITNGGGQAKADFGGAPSITDAKTSKKLLLSPKFHLLFHHIYGKQTNTLKVIVSWWGGEGQ